jgi:hypothetical protein
MAEKIYPDNSDALHSHEATRGAQSVFVHRGMEGT